MAAILINFVAAWAMMNKKLVSAIAAIAVITVVASIAATVNINFAYAKISPGSCTNGGGEQPTGQQPTCKNESGLTQEPATNPAGSPPPGQNK